MFERSEFARTPLGPSNAACPQRKRRADESGSPFLWVLSFGEAKESTSPAGARPGKAAEPETSEKRREVNKLISPDKPQ
jgi:hypothetical protein